MTVPLEAYVARVLTAEALPDSHPAALEALAITIRTYALANLGRHGLDGFDLCDETHCQVMRTATAATERAAAATSGRILIDGAAPASVFYSASCGGRTEVPSAVWPGEPDRPFLPTQQDDACRGAPVWATELASNDLFRSFRAAGFRGDRLRDMKILGRNSSGRVARLRLEGLQPDEISGQDLRVVVGRTLGWQHIKSTAFDLTRTSDGYRLRGHGSGHGVGLCVIGSARRAEAGEKADAILHRYFPGLPIAAPPDAFLANAARKLEARSAAAADFGVRPESPAATPRVVSNVSIALPPADEIQRGEHHRPDGAGSRRAGPHTRGGGARPESSLSPHCRQLRARHGHAMVYLGGGGWRSDSSSPGRHTARARRARTHDPSRARPRDDRRCVGHTTAVGA